MLDDSLTVNISELAKAITDIQNRAIVEYTPLVNDICSRKTTKDEVDQIQSNHLIITRWKISSFYTATIFAHIKILREIQTKTR